MSQSPEQTLPVLHILNKVPDQPRFRACLQSVSSSDTLVLIEDGVIALSDEGQTLPEHCLALADDVRARGLSEKTPDARLIDHAALVELTVQHSRIICW
ncbi:sulfurtransferase complex subunit TusB [Marinobacter oulmenensis]|uniref:tRNA 2-thiouridine synthesizing protein B n=1 Tax=Marinobacter oulmenensis TaxID=643747 RepID=A0A840UDT1_9GAMM|nr:sulfurtransferase complex subunit TusB [Marinobacter oulmenensis]MBB5320605.1 tRNA 2-thiouridine synthesizing protein B [Marinobacter oulmenensis]